jgi:hypothetical protein
MALQTVESKNLQQITIHYPTILTGTIEEAVHQAQEWQELDRLLVQFWTSRSIRPKIT